MIKAESCGLRSGSPDDCLMVIFGASGDLTRRSLLPSLFELALKDLLPESFAVIGFARTDWDDDTFREHMRDGVRDDCDFDEKIWDGLADRMHYMSGDLNSDDDFDRLASRIDEIRDRHHLPDNVFFHLATPPSFFATIAGRLQQSGLSESREGWRRIVVEKPFGEDRSSAQKLHRDLQEVFEEDQIYRIDHFLGKETVQNMLVFRFANPSFEPIWNRHYIDHVQVTVAEDIGIGTRGEFYEKTGVFRDMVQNHLLQLLCMTAIEPPSRYDARALRDETAKVLRAITPPGTEDCVGGQYGAGRIDGDDVIAYRNEDHVARDSSTPTFAALRLDIDNWRWAGVPFYLRTGKRMARKLTEVSVHFKPTPHAMFPSAGRVPNNVLTFRLQPEEGILDSYIAKQPGPDICLASVTSSFLYADAFQVTSPPRAYAWLILDVMEGEQTLFAREDWVDQAWSIVDPIVTRWEDDRSGEVPLYAAGSWGPESSELLLRRDGRSWRTE